MAQPGAEDGGTHGKAVAEIKDQAVDQAHELKDTAVEHVGTVTQEAKEKATNVAHDVRRELETQGDSQAQRLAIALHDAGRQLQGMADGAGPGPLTQVTRQLADGTERLAGRVDDGGLHGIGDELRTFAQRQPVLFLVAAGTAGFLVTRMLRHAVAWRWRRHRDAGVAVAVGTVRERRARRSRRRRSHERLRAGHARRVVGRVVLAPHVRPERIDARRGAAREDRAER